LQLPVQGVLEPLAVEVPADQRFIGLHDGEGRYDDPQVTGFAKCQDPLAGGVLLLNQGKLENEVGFDVDVQAARS
jgi:hypothetical protein